MSYVFWCSKCKVDHAGECQPVIDPSSTPNFTYIDFGKKSIIESIAELVKALEAGNYNAAPSRECGRTNKNDLCAPCDPAVCEHPFSPTDPGVITFSYKVKLPIPLAFIPISFTL